MSADYGGKRSLNLKARIRTYAEHSTIKCLPRFVRSESFVHRLLWVMTFVIGTSLALYLLVGLLRTYTSYEVTLSVRAEEGGRPPFPDLTVCNLNPLWNNADGWGLLARIEGVPYPLRYDEYIYFLYQQLHQSETGGDPTFDQTNPELYSVSGYLKHTGYARAMLDELRDILIWKCLWEDGNTQRPCVVEPTVTPTNGLCYTIKPPEGEGQKVKPREEALAVILFLNNTDTHFVADYRLSPFQSYTEGVKVYLHARGTVPEMNRGFTVAPGTEASVVAKHHTRKLLKQPYGSCDDNNLNAFANLSPLPDWQYTQYACRSLCYQSRILDECGCLDSTEIIPETIISNSRYCSIFSLTNPERAFDDLNCSRTVKAELDAAGTCHAMCPSSCEQYSYEAFVNQVPWPSDVYIMAFYFSILRTHLPSESFRVYELALSTALAGNTSDAWAMIRSIDLVKRNFLQLSITMDDTVVVEEDKPAITLAAIVGSLGGILNLYIGFNLITIADFLDFFLTLIIDNMTVRKVNNTKHEKTEQTMPNVTTVESFRI